MNGPTTCPLADYYAVDAAGNPAKLFTTTTTRCFVNLTLDAALINNVILSDAVNFVALTKFPLYVVGTPFFLYPVAVGATAPTTASTKFSVTPVLASVTPTTFLTM